jgi:hypothetical protein
MERLVQILLLSTPAATAGRLAAVEGLVLGLDEAGVLWTGKLVGTGGAWSVLWTEVADPARVEREAALEAQDVEADKRRP